VEGTLSADKLSNFLAEVTDKAKKYPQLMKKYFSASYILESPTKLASNNRLGVILGGALWDKDSSFWY
jgi:hypothetical protein